MASLMSLALNQFVACGDVTSKIRSSHISIRGGCRGGVVKMDVIPVLDVLPFF